jgi:hypothetical protein
VATSGPDTDNAWYMDSGVTDHITGELDQLTMHEPYTGIDQIHAANDSGMAITRIGTSFIPTFDCDLVLNKVLHVPSTHKKLISVHRFTLDNYTYIEFHLFFFLIKDQKMRQVLLQGPCRGGLYPLPPSTSKFQKLVFHAIKTPVHQWHSRLGHPSRDIVRRVISKNNLPCATLDSSCSSVCDACACAKAHQLPYQLSSNTSSAPLQLIFSYVWGHAIGSFGQKGTMFPLLMTIVSLLGYTYSITNMRFTSIFLNFRPLLSVCLIVKLSPFNPIGVGNTSISIPYFIKLASPIKSLVLTPINKMGLLSTITVI